ncbi:MAG: tetratricopeptide repeat protein [Proteobacteria bacterium]|nr:tetratricopeptide repeat protein [Pseudomonadota bacterium]
MAATASHPVVAKARAPSREQPAFESAWASHASLPSAAPAESRARRRGAAGGSAPEPEIADLTDDAVEEFAAQGGSLHEVLASVTASHRAAVPPQDWDVAATPVSRSQARPAAAPPPRRQSAGVDALRDQAGAGPGATQGAPQPARSRGEALTALLGRAAQLHNQGQPTEALELCRRALQLAPGHALATALAQRLELVIVEDAESRIGSLESIPIVRVPANEITWHKLDHQAGFVLSRIDGLLSYNDVLTVSGMPRAAALRTLVRLLELKLIASQH